MEWLVGRHTALVFSNGETAREFIKEKQVFSVRLVYHSGDQRYDFVALV
jgi:hypothetical protein